MNFERAFIALGANLGDPVAQVRAGLEELAILRASRLARVSSLYRSAPVGVADQPDFVNAVALIETALAPSALLGELLSIERRRGRVRTVPNGPRTLDLDILLYADRTVDEPALCIPHPRMHERAFVIVPLAEIASDVVVPGRGQLSDMLTRVDTASLTRIEQ